MKINFRLKSIDKIEPVGTELKIYISWFWLTDAELWIALGDDNIYEYSQEALAYFEDKPSRYNDYPLVRFIEDFTKLFEQISESVPGELYELTPNLKQFVSNTKEWLDIYDTEEEEISDFYFEEYYNIMSWTYARSFDSGHLVGGPRFTFFRCEDKIRIIWETESQLENGIELWTAKNGSIELDYFYFIEQVKSFSQRFFSQMEKQVNLAVMKDWGKVQIDKNRLVEEHNERKEDFDRKIAYLENGSTLNTDWKLIKSLYCRMKNEI
ncbi:MAG: hypothetical protein JEZ14_13120 [Marinilabiliaceae bacterium]|nr:hypothetical protein [Marinilabiliaceae bacterium]